MFQSAFSSAMVAPSHSRSQQFASVYRQVDIDTAAGTASPHQLVLMLFDGCLESIGRAQIAMSCHEVEVKCAQISRAVRILEEGLKSALDLAAGGELAVNLHNLYAYCVVQLIRSNLRNDPALLLEVERLIRPLRDAWAAIGANFSHGAAG